MNVTETAYLRTFWSDLAPPMLRLVAALNGFTPPPADDFDYCELGFGKGDTLAATAAAHPRSRFVGVDLNPEHVAFATGLASAGGLTNVRFLERDLEDLASSDLPSFDFMCAHGLLSWVSPEKRRAAIALASKKLRPGGLFFVSYNALPGWAAVAPLRRLLVDGAAGAAGDALARARQGLGLAKLLHDAGAAYFANNPAAGEMMATMMKMGLPYVVHEYLQDHWHPMYFADLAREMADQGLYFIGQLPLHLNYRDLALPPKLVELFKGVSDRIAFESLKDFSLNEFFRRDVFIKDAVGRSEETTRRHLDTTPFGTLVEAARVQRSVALPHYTLKLAGPVFDALIPALAERVSTVTEIAARPDLAAFGADRIRESMLHLALGGQVVPMQRSTAATDATTDAAGGERWRVPLAYNRMILEQRLSNESPIVLASTVAGTGIVVSMLEATAIRALTEVDSSGRSEWIRAFVARHPVRLRAEAQVIEDAGEQARVLGEEVEKFQRGRLRALVGLGVLEAAG